MTRYDPKLTDEDLFGDDEDEEGLDPGEYQKCIGCRYRLEFGDETGITHGCTCEHCAFV